MTHAEFKSNEIDGHFAKLVYSVRNAIVHNKETELHLTYANLDAAVCNIMEAFVIPCLEEMCFALVGTKNQQIWYSNKEILLYS